MDTELVQQMEGIWNTIPLFQNFFSLRKMLRKSMDSWGITTAKSLQRRPSKVDPFKVQSQRSNARMQETSLSTTNGVVSKNSTNNTK